MVFLAQVYLIGLFGKGIMVAASKKCAPADSTDNVQKVSHIQKLK